MLLATGALIAAGCSQESQSDAKQAGQNAGQAIKKDLDTASKATSNDLESAKVQQALSAASGLITKDIHVDSDTIAKTITLSGLAQTAAQKAQAIKIATGIAGTEYKVIDKLNVSAPDKKV
ncbi:MAG TPA: BON domain-containing protein [Fimbriimonadaceae bacterium]|nr:BON domain-containing protein [Fimbriimonadaceae bacterium]